MNTTIRRIVLCLAGAFALGGCALLQDDPRALRIEPLQVVHHGAARPDAMYAMGRYYQGQGRAPQALAAFREVLLAQPEHVEARNALGVILAARGRFDLAIPELERAARAAPAAAHIRNNLGYAYLLQGRVKDALATLELARALDPSNPRVEENLRMARAADYQASHGAGPATSPATAAPDEAPAATPQPESGARLVAVAPGVFELHDKPRAAASLPTRSAEHKRVRLEVANGNGISGLARRTANELARFGFTPARLTNQPPYRLATTQIQYRPGLEPEVRRLQASLQRDVALVPTNDLRPGVGLRLALGKDVHSATQLVHAPASPLLAARTGE